MNSIIENTLYHLTSQRHFEEVSEDQISGIVNEYPFFAPGQLLFGLKLNKENHYKTSSQLHKTGLFFNNPEWFSYHLQTDENRNYEVPYFENIHSKEEISEPPFQATESIETAPQHFQHIEIPTLEEVKGIMTGNATAPEVVEHVAEEANELIVPILAEHSIAEPVHEVHHHTEQLEAGIDEYDREFTDEQENESENEESDHHFQMSIPQSISNQLADAKAGLSKHLPNEELDIKYNNEPYHAVDYFDSQGIKLDLSKLPQDKLTRQLLKFTDWLKHVKNVSPNPKDLGTEPELETIVQSDAQHSNDSREIYTETMAEVYAKQGKLEKAIQIYIKLSFLNPNKTAFFAKKIQDLKGI